MAVDRRKQGLKRSVAVEASGLPLAAVPAPANRRDDGLLAATLDALEVVGLLPTWPVVHLDAGYDYQPCRQVLAERGMIGQIATRGIPAPIQDGRRAGGVSDPAIAAAEHQDLDELVEDDPIGDAGPVTAQWVAVVTGGQQRGDLDP